LLRTIIVDDEPPALGRLEKLLTDSSMATVEGKFTEALEALDYLKNNQVDAVFLDIEMPDMDGIELASRIIDLQEKTAIVFVTACNQYAVEAFHLNALDYLLKPVSADRLKESLNRIIEEKGILLPSGRIHINCFGKFGVFVGEEEVKFRTEKAQELLAFLINNKGGYVSRSKIIDNLWEDFEGDRAIAHLNTTLHNVKKALLQYGIHINVIYDTGSYRMDADGVSCDYLQFRDFILTVGAVSGNNILDFEKAAALYSGEYLSGWDFEWIEGKRLQMEEEYVQLLLAISNYYLEIGDYQSAVKWLKIGLQQEPLHRELNYRLIEALLLCKEQVIAMKYFKIFSNGLMKKSGMEPDEDFQRMMRLKVK